MGKNQVCHRVQVVISWLVIILILIPLTAYGLSDQQIVDTLSRLNRESLANYNAAINELKSRDPEMQDYLLIEITARYSNEGFKLISAFQSVASGLDNARILTGIRTIGDLFKSLIIKAVALQEIILKAELKRQLGILLGVAIDKCTTDAFFSLLSSQITQLSIDENSYLRANEACERFLSVSNEISQRLNEVSVVAPTIPAAPSNLTITYYTSGLQLVVALAWQDNSANEDGFKIERKRNELFGDWAEVGDTKSPNYSQTAQFIDNASSLVTYCYRVIAYIGIIESSPSNEACTHQASAAEIPELLIDGTDASVRKQGDPNSFKFTGFGFKPSTSAMRHIKGIGQNLELKSSIKVLPSGALDTWEFRPDCNTVPDTYEIWVMDVEKGDSNHVYERIEPNPALCTQSPTPSPPPLSRGAPPTLKINNGTSSRQPQLTGTFRFEGFNFTPGREADQHIIHKTTRIDYSDRIPVKPDGSIFWQFTPGCGSPTGEYDVWVTDPVKGDSNHVKEIIDPAPNCSPKPQPPVTPPSPRSAPQLFIDGGTYSSKPQGSTFNFTATGFNAYSPVTQYIKQPDGTLRTGTVTADASGNVTWPFPSTCSTAVGTYTIFLVDESSGLKSNEVTEVITQSSSCVPPPVTPPPPQPPPPQFNVPNIDLSTTTLFVGEAVIGAFYTNQLVIYNSGEEILVGNVFTSSSTFLISPSSFSISPGSSQIIEVTFLPQWAGYQSDVLTITSNDPDEPTLIVEVTGNGVEVPPLYPSPPPPPAPIYQGQAPQITFVGIPSTITVDVPTDWQLGFNDPDGDITWIQFSDGGAWDPGVRGQTQGTIWVKSTCRTPGLVTTTVTLLDAAGLSSAPYTYSYQCVGESFTPPPLPPPPPPPPIFGGSAPVITGISIHPGWTEVYGSIAWEVYFEDPDGDVSLIEFREATGGFYGPATWVTTGAGDPGVRGLYSGVISVTTTCNRTGVFPKGVILYDAAGHSSELQRYVLNCVQAYASSVGKSPSTPSTSTETPGRQKLPLAKVKVSTRRVTEAYQFMVQGTGIKSVDLQILDLQGHVVFRRSADSPTRMLTWALKDEFGRPSPAASTST